LVLILVLVLVLVLVSALALALAWETALRMLKDDNNWIQCLLASVNNLIGRKQEAEAPRVPEFPNVGVRSVQNTSHPVDASSACCVYRNNKYEEFKMNNSLNKLHIWFL
jgi:hypothetical protein